MTSPPVDRRMEDAVVLESLGGTTMDVFRTVWRARDRASEEGGHPYRSSATGSGARVVVARRLYAGDDFAAEYFDRLVRLRLALGPEHCPRVLHVHAVDGMSVACIEEDVGDVSFRSLMNRLAEPLPIGLALYLVRAVVSAWRALEGLGRTRDAVVGATGVRLGWDGRVRLLACPSERPRRESDPTVVARTPVGASWFAPEIMRGAPCPESVMFAAGMMLFEALAGRRPFESSNFLDLLHKILEVELPDTLATMPHVPPAVAALVRRCSEKRAEDRFASWAELDAALDHASRAAEPAGKEELRRLLERTFPKERALAGAREVEARRLMALADPYDADTVTVPVAARSRPPDEPSLDAQPELELHGTDGRPMIRISPTLLVDLRPVSGAEYARYLVATNQRGTPLGPDRAALAVTGVTLDDALGYARWAQKRIPEGDEWALAARIAGETLLDVGAVWELTVGDRAGDGWLVRGGPWRDQTGARGHAENLSHSDAAPDVGFRCVADG